MSKVFSDTMSGARDDRPGLAALMDIVRDGDTVAVWKLDRLGRDMLHIVPPSSGPRRALREPSSVGPARSPTPTTWPPLGG